MEMYKKRDGKDSKVDKSKIKCLNCDGVVHFANEYRKSKSSKGSEKTLITSSKDRMDSSNSDKKENYAFIANVEETFTTSEKAFQTD